MRRIVLATGNAGKVREFDRLFAAADMEIVPQTQFGIAAIVENGLSFVENALLKARHAAIHSELPAIGDDSGLEVEALNGAPGIYSARYAGPGADDTSNWQKLLADLEGVPTAKRTARFHCVLVYLRSEDDPMPLICEGTWQGTILDAARGGNGFGYDPVFYVPELKRSAAEIPVEIKDALSHRGQALRQLLNKLNERS